MSTGKTLRVRNIWKHKRAVIVPFDHGSYSGPVSGIEDLRRLTERIASTEADAILITPGMLPGVADIARRLGIILRLDGGFTRFASTTADYRPMLSCERAVWNGADAGILFTFVGTSMEGESLQRLADTSASAQDCGLPLIAEVLPAGLLNNHFGSTIFDSPANVSIWEQTYSVVRIAAEAGADIIKTRYVGTVEEFRRIVDSSGARVIVAGGPPTDGSDEQLLRLASNCVEAGAAGIVFGRIVWQHKKMEQLIAALCAIVHEEESVENALKLMR